MSSFHPFAARGGLKYVEAYQTGNPVVDSARWGILETLDMVLESHLSGSDPKQEIDLFKRLYGLLSDYFEREEAWRANRPSFVPFDVAEQHRTILSDLLWRILSFTDNRTTFSEVFTYIGFDIVIRHFGEEEKLCEQAG